MQEIIDEDGFIDSAKEVQKQLFQKREAKVELKEIRAVMN